MLRDIKTNQLDNTSQFEAVLIIVAAFVTILLGFFVIVIKYNKSRIKNIKDKQAFQQTLLTAQIETQEQTFENISQELHDNIGQQITALNFQLQNQKLKQPENKEWLDRLSDRVSTIALQLQTLSHSLNPNWLQQQGLVSAIGQELERLQNISSIAFQYQYSDSELITLNAEQQIIVFRIFQEIINNALKHAAANNIVVRIQKQKPFQLSITDDGVGFDIELNNGKGMGLHNIQNRARVIGFDCQIVSEKGKGTSFLLTEQISL
jgi:signal transduction histidine kinase